MINLKNILKNKSKLLNMDIKDKRDEIYLVKRLLCHKGPSTYYVTSKGGRGGPPKGDTSI